MMVAFAELRESLAAAAATRANAYKGDCTVTVLRYQLGLRFECWRGKICASKNVDWMLVLASHNPIALFDYHIAKLAAGLRSDHNMRVSNGS